MPTSNARATTTRPRPNSSSAEHALAERNGHGTFVVPIVHVSLPESAVTLGFWSALIGSVALGTVDLPLAALIGASVVIAKHHRLG